MAEGQGGHGLVGQWEPEAGLWLVRGAVPGPAGSVGLALAHGIEADLDAARPGTLTGLSVELPAGASPPPERHARIALAAILGPAAATALLDLRPGPAARLPGAGAAGGDLGTLGRAALARAAAAGAAPLVRGVGLLEASVSLAGIGAAAGDLVRRDAEEGGALLLEVAAAGGLHLPDPRTARELASVLRRAATLLGGRRPLLDLAAEVGRGRDDVRRPAAADAQLSIPAAMAPASRAAAAAPMAAGGALRVVRPVLVDRSHLPSGVAPADVGAVAAGPAEVEVQLAHAAGRAAGWWARASGPDGTVLALAPVVEAGEDAVARLLVPPLAVAGVEIDLTAEPAAPRPSPRLRAAERAVLLGQAAARASRLGRAGAAARWVACGQAWAEAGDDERAALAVDPARRGEPGPPLLVDHLVEA